MPNPKLNIVVAACNNMGIGIDGRIPWRLKKDMAFFKKITCNTNVEGKQNAVIMGKKTWFSIPEKFRPLPNRVNVVLSSQLPEAPAGAQLARSFTEALHMLDNSDVENIFVIGGSSVYRDAINSPNPCRIYLTRVVGDFQCDVFFLDLDLNIFEKVENPEDIVSENQEEKDIQFCFEVYEKRLSNKDCV